MKKVTHTYKTVIGGQEVEVKVYEPATKDDMEELLADYVDDNPTEWDETDLPEFRKAKKTYYKQHTEDLVGILADEDTLLGEFDDEDTD